jgi:hypothetical protein
MLEHPGWPGRRQVETPGDGPWPARKPPPRRGVPRRRAPHPVRSSLPDTLNTHAGPEPVHAERSPLARSRSPRRKSERWSVAIARGSHPFPSRTRQLSPAARMVLPGRPGGRVRRRRPSIRTPPVPFSIRGGGCSAFRRYLRGGAVDGGYTRRWTEGCAEPWAEDRTDKWTEGWANGGRRGAPPPARMSWARVGRAGQAVALRQGATSEEEFVVLSLIPWSQMPPPPPPARDT